MDGSRERQLRGAAAPTDGVLGLEDRDTRAMARELDGGGEAVRAAADDDGAALSQS